MPDQIGRFKGTMIALVGGAQVLIPENPEKAHCRACKKEILFAITKKEHRMPIEQDLPGRWVSHFSTCPEAQRFRKGKKG